MKLKDEFLQAVQDKGIESNYRTYKSILTSLEPWEEILQKELHQFTAQDFFKAFAGLQWTKPTTFSNKRTRLANYLDWLKLRGIPCDSQIVRSLQRMDIPDEVAFRTLFDSAEQFAQAVRSVYLQEINDRENGVKTFAYLQEALALLLAWIGLNSEEICDLKKTNVFPAEHKISAASGREFHEIDDCVMDLICSTQNIQMYLYNGSYRVFEDNVHVVGRGARKTPRNTGFVETLFASAREIWKNAPKPESLAYKSIQPRNLSRSHLYWCLLRYEKENGNTVMSSITHDYDQFSKLVSYWNGSGFSSQRVAMEQVKEYILWRKTI